MFSDEECTVLGWKLGVVISSLARDPMALIGRINAAYENLPEREKQEALRLFEKALRLLKKMKKEVKN